MFKNKKILITGGTGSLGQSLTKRLLENDVDTIRILSRNEEKQNNMKERFVDERLRFFIGDVRDKERLRRALEDIDIVFHAAALKHVPVIEYNPFEAIKTNVIGSQNVIDTCLEENVERAICVGTDKAVSPLNTYGATKLLMEKLFVSADNYLNKNRHQTKFIALRYGNVLGSSGSVVPLFIKQIKNKQKITITDEKMTRFSITMNEALDFILESAENGKGSEIFVPKLKAYSIVDLKNALFEIFGSTDEQINGIRPGEKLHETLINFDEGRNTYEIDNKYVIVKDEMKNDYKDNVNFRQQYSSDNAEKLSKEELVKIISDNRGKVMHMLRSDSSIFKNFGEIYFSTIYTNLIKGWHLHKEATLNYACVKGKVKLVLFDDRDSSPTKGKLYELILSPENYFLVTVPPNIWNGFKGLDKSESIIANCLTLPHNEKEMVRKEPNDKKFNYNWG